jgi:hypothetical protein
MAVQYARSFHILHALTTDNQEKEAKTLVSLVLPNVLLTQTQTIIGFYAQTAPDRIFITGWPNSIHQVMNHWTSN